MAGNEVLHAKQWRAITAITACSNDYTQKQIWFNCTIPVDRFLYPFTRSVPVLFPPSDALASISSNEFNFTPRGPHRVSVDLSRASARKAATWPKHRATVFLEPEARVGSSDLYPCFMQHCGEECSWSTCGSARPASPTLSDADSV